MIYEIKNGAVDLDEVCAVSEVTKLNISLWAFDIYLKNGNFITFSEEAEDLAVSRQKGLITEWKNNRRQKPIMRTGND